MSEQTCCIVGPPYVSQSISCKRKDTYKNDKERLWISQKGKCR